MALLKCLSFCVSFFFFLLFFSKWLHGDSKEVQVSLLHFFCHAPVHPKAPHAFSHGREAVPLWHLRQEVYQEGAHEEAHAGEEKHTVTKRGQHLKTWRVTLICLDLFDACWYGVERSLAYCFIVVRSCIYLGGGRTLRRENWSVLSPAHLSISTMEQFRRPE